MNYCSNFLSGFGCLVFWLPFAAAAEPQPIRIGWIGSITGAVAKFGAFQSATLALEDINAQGGIGGRPLELIFEDGKGEGRSAVLAAQKLLDVDHVTFLLGGHCSPESLPIAPVVESHHALMLASITTTPKLTGAGDNVFRVSPVSTIVGDQIAEHLLKQRGFKRVAIIYEETDYAQPPAERLRDRISAGGGVVTSYDGVQRDSTDFRALLTKIRSQHPDALYIGAQAPDMAQQITRQLLDLGISLPLVGNEITGNAVSGTGSRPEAFEGLVFSEPEFDRTAPKTAAFLQHYQDRFHTGLPLGFWSAEAYDSVRLLAETIGRCGEAVDDVKRCLYATKDYEGVSGRLSIDSHGDGVRTYILKQVRSGKIEVVPPGPGA